MNVEHHLTQCTHLELGRVSVDGAPDHRVLVGNILPRGGRARAAGASLEDPRASAEQSGSDNSRHSDSDEGVCVSQWSLLVV